MGIQSTNQMNKFIQICHNQIIQKRDLMTSRLEGLATERGKHWIPPFIKDGGENSIHLTSFVILQLGSYTITERYYETFTQENFKRGGGGGEGGIWAGSQIQSE